MRAVGKFLVIKEHKETGTKTKGGLLLSEAQREDIRYRKASVVSTGDEVNYIKKDHEIYYDRRAGYNVELKKEIYRVIREQDVVIVL